MCLEGSFSRVFVTSKPGLGRIERGFAVKVGDMAFGYGFGI